MVLAAWASAGAPAAAFFGRHTLAWQVLRNDVTSKIARQMAARGWNREMIRRAITAGRQFPEVNMANGNPAARFVDPQTGLSVVVDLVTKAVIHVGAAGFRYGLR